MEHKPKSHWEPWKFKFQLTYVGMVFNNNVDQCNTNNVIHNLYQRLSSLEMSSLNYNGNSSFGVLLLTLCICIKPPHVSKSK
jgi:hypothetical protein